MTRTILMRALSPEMEHANLARWLKHEGDEIKPGDVIAEVETDKATMELVSEHGGLLVKILVPDGTTEVPVNTVLAMLENPADSVEISMPVAASPSARENAVGRNGRLFASPRARVLARDSGIDLEPLNGSGPHGRILERDVLQVMAQHAAPPVPMPAQDVRTLFPPGSYTELRHDGMRTSIARRLLEAKQTIPHFCLSVDCELDALASLREQLNQGARSTYKLSTNDFVIKALARALILVPEANVSWAKDALLMHKYADLGVAVAIPGGLITPVIRRAESKSLPAISNEMKDLAARAKARKLKPEEYEGGTAAISNLGMFGVKSFVAIINPPHATILAVGAGEKRCVVKNSQPSIATIMTCTLSVDHRAVDGAVGAKLLAEFKRFIENPVSLLV